MRKIKRQTKQAHLNLIGIAFNPAKAFKLSERERRILMRVSYTPVLSGQFQLQFSSQLMMLLYRILVFAVSGDEILFYNLDRLKKEICQLLDCLGEANRQAKEKE